MIEWIIALALGAYGFQSASYLGALSGFASALREAMIENGILPNRNTTNP